MAQESNEQEVPAPFKVAKIRPQLVSRGKKGQSLFRTDILGATVQVVTSGGETNLHAHAGSDAAWLVISGRAKFYTEGDRLVAELGKHDMLLIPRGTLYWFESSSSEPLVILRFSARAQDTPDRRIDKEPRRQLPREVIEGQYFEG
ncbi:MAG TPA: cupin domain-containing protein [Candidatus Acidoferrales bacterium]|nr:cupin domain-containing protein [Candidatus Acidoferrales bacterium]